MSENNMDQKLKRVFGAMGAIVYGLCLSSQALSQTLPDGKGKTEFVHSCTTCHRADTVTSARKTPDDWKKSVADMAARGASGTPEELNNIALYLSTNFPATAAGSAPAQAAPPPPPAQAPLTAAELETVTGLIADNGCIACHRIEKQGGYTGPSLNGVGARRTPDQVQAAIVHPHPTLAPENDLVQLTTADGKTIAGRIVSQDDHSVRVIDAAGETTTYAKAGLRKFTILDTNPMPSYQKRIAPEDLSSLVRYLRSLPSLDESVQK
jgi:putative heme-binding domain-containing protein